MRKMLDSSKTCARRAIEGLRGPQVAPQRLLHDDAGPACAARSAERGHHFPEQARRNCEIVQRRSRVPERVTQPAEGVRVAVIAADEVQASTQVRQHRCVDGIHVRAHAFRDPVLDARETPLLAGQPEHGPGQPSTADQLIDGRNDLLEREVAADPEDHQGVRLGMPRLSHAA